mgnify:CR=1 FL=1
MRSVGGLFQSYLHGFSICSYLCMVKPHIKHIETDLKQTSNRPPFWTIVVRSVVDHPHTQHTLSASSVRVRPRMYRLGKERRVSRVMPCMRRAARRAHARCHVSLTLELSYRLRFYSGIYPHVKNRSTGNVRQESKCVFRAICGSDR